MSILFSDEILNTIYNELSLAKESVQIITAYCKLNALEKLSAQIPTAISSKKLLVRFRLSDIASGSTDFSILEYCLSHRWEVYIRFDLHAKTYIIDNTRGIVGSANMTSAGLRLNDKANYEIASFVNLTDEDKKKVERLFSDSLKITADVLSSLKKQYSTLNFNNLSDKSLSWNIDILNKFRPEITTLFSYELPDTNVIPTGNEFLSFLEIHADSGKHQIKDTFRYSNCYSWLLSTLRKNNGCMYFGHLTDELHDALVEDPKPYRKDVKILLSNLLAWVQSLQMEDVIIDVPNHSQRIRLAAALLSEE